MINEEKLKKFLSRWIEIPDESAEQQRLKDLDGCFEELSDTEKTEIKRGELY